MYVRCAVTLWSDISHTNLLLNRWREQDESEAYSANRYADALRSVVLPPVASQGTTDKGKAVETAAAESLGGEASREAMQVG
jgi:hypothetical protein